MHFCPDEARALALVAGFLIMTWTTIKGWFAFRLKRGSKS